MDHDDRDLVRQCLEGDEDSCARLVQVHARMVGTVVWRAKLSTWVYTIAHRVAIDHLRQVRLNPDTTVVEPSADVVSGFSRTAVAPERNPEAAAADEELDAIIREQLQGLPDKYRLPLVYATLDELDYQTIGTMLKVKPGTVKTLVFRGRQLLRARVEAVLDRRRERSHAT